MSLLTANKIVCKYLSYLFTSNGESHYIRLPLVHTVLESRTDRIATDGLVDSGATATFIPREIADTISLLPSGQLTSPMEATGAGGRFPTIPVKLKRLTLIKNVSPFCECVETPVLVTEEEGRLPYVILGRDHVFRRFNITFMENRRKFMFERI